MAFDTIRDLLGLPYLRGSDDPKNGLDCWGAVVVAYERMGRPVPRLTPGLAGKASWPAIVEAGRSCEADPEPWAFLGTDLACARELGDVVRLSSDDPAGGVAVLVSQRPQWFLTSTPDRGVIVRRAQAFQRFVTGVYRMRAA